MCRDPRDGGVVGTDIVPPRGPVSGHHLSVRECGRKPWRRVLFRVFPGVGYWGLVKKGMAGPCDLPEDDSGGSIECQQDIERPTGWLFGLSCSRRECRDTAVSYSLPRQCRDIRPMHTCTHGLPSWKDEASGASACPLPMLSL